MYKYYLQNRTTRQVTITVPGTYTTVNFAPREKIKVRKPTREKQALYKAIASLGIVFIREKIEIKEVK